MELLTKNRVLVPTDFSEPAVRAQNAALNFVEAPSQLHMLYVLPRINPGDPGVMWKNVSDVTRVQNVDREFRKRFSDPRYQQVQFQVLIGNASNKIVEYAKAQKIELIVIAPRGQTKVSRFRLGSVAERVVRYAPCPVLVMRSSSESLPPAT